MLNKSNGGFNVNYGSHSYTRVGKLKRPKGSGSAAQYTPVWCGRREPDSDYDPKKKTEPHADCRKLGRVVL